jgi:hypothetical protein
MNTICAIAWETHCGTGPWRQLRHVVGRGVHARSGRRAGRLLSDGLLALYYGACHAVALLCCDLGCDLARALLCGVGPVVAT